MGLPNSSANSHDSRGIVRGGLHLSCRVTIALLIGIAGKLAKYRYLKRSEHYIYRQIHRESDIF